MADWPCVGGGERSWADVLRAFGSGARGARTVRVEVCDSAGARRGQEIGVRFTTLTAFVRGCLLAPPHRYLPDDRGDAARGATNELVPLTYGKRDWWGLREADRSRIGYLAQYELLRQIPELRDDIGALPYVDALGAGYRVRTNVWLGAAGSTTALHMDPSDNLLCQVAGFKYVRLYGPQCTAHMYQETAQERRMEGDMLRSAGNFSLADVEASRSELVEKFPKLAGCPYLETVLGPGEMLYIPWGCWHYCRALTASASVNVWWNRGAEDLRRVPCFGAALEKAGLLESTAASKRLPDRRVRRHEAK